jgi:hypothetical protein
VTLSTHTTSPSDSPPFSPATLLSLNSLLSLYWVGSGEEVVETDMCQEDKKQRKWLRKIMYGRAKSGNCRRMKDPRKVGKEVRRKN